MNETLRWFTQAVGGMLLVGCDRGDHSGPSVEDRSSSNEEGVHSTPVALVKTFFKAMESDDRKTMSRLMTPERTEHMENEGAWDTWLAAWTVLAVVRVTVSHQKAGDSSRQQDFTTEDAGSGGAAKPGSGVVVADGALPCESRPVRWGASPCSERGQASGGTRGEAMATGMEGPTIDTPAGARATSMSPASSAVAAWASSGEARQVALERKVALEVISGSRGLSSRAVLRFRR